jgi:hypothetical protein
LGHFLTPHKLPNQQVIKEWTLNAQILNLWFRANNPINKWPNELNRQFSTVQMSDKHMKNYSTSLAIKEIVIKMTLRLHLTPVRMAVIKKIQMLVRMWGKRIVLYLWWEFKLVNQCGNQDGVSSKIKPN